MTNTDAPLTIAAIAEKTQLPLRVVKFWGDQGVLVARPETAGAGRGVYRIYPEHELYVAAVLGSLTAARVPVGIMRMIAWTLRIPFQRITGVPVVQVGDPSPSSMGETALRAAMSGDGRNVVVIYLKNGTPYPSFRYFAGDSSSVISITELVTPSGVPAGGAGRNTLCVAIDLNEALAGVRP